MADATITAVGWSRDGIATRIAADLENGWRVNLGIGIPLLIPPHVPAGVDVILHSENGALGLGPPPPEGEGDPDLTDAGKNFVTLAVGASIFDSATSFALVRGGHLDLAVLGGLQVSANGDLANWNVPGGSIGVGGAMDLVAGARRIWVAMEHTDRKGDPKILKECSFYLTGRGVVDRVYTNLGVFDLENGLTLVECAPGVTVDYIAERTDAPFEVLESIE
jgi:3-oxoacid CoA-transferase subunit B